MRNHHKNSEFTRFTKIFRRKFVYITIALIITGPGSFRFAKSQQLLVETEEADSLSLKSKYSRGIVKWRPQYNRNN